MTSEASPSETDGASGNPTDAHDADAAPKPDLNEAQNLLDALGGPGATFTFQTFDDGDKKRDELTRVLHGTFDDHVAELQRLNHAGAGIFVMVNRGDLKGRSAANVTAVRALFVDLDGAPLAPIRAETLAPHILVESSPGRYHAYWFVSDCPLDDFRQLQTALMRKFGGDPKVKDLCRVMRLPGFLHQKGTTAHRTQLLKAHTATPPYSVAQITDALGLRFDDQTAAGARPREASEQFNRQRAREGVPEGERDDQLYKLACSYRREGQPRAEAEKLVREAAANCMPPLPEDEAMAKVAQAWLHRPEETATIRRLAALPLIQYDQQREEAAKDLGIRVSILDGQVAQERPKTSSMERRLNIKDPEPWPSPVNLDELLSGQCPRRS